MASPTAARVPLSDVEKQKIRENLRRHSQSDSPQDTQRTGERLAPREIPITSGAPSQSESQKSPAPARNPQPHAAAEQTAKAPQPFRMDLWGEVGSRNQESGIRNKE